MILPCPTLDHVDGKAEADANAIYEPGGRA